MELDLENWYYRKICEKASPGSTGRQSPKAYYSRELTQPGPVPDPERRTGALGAHPAASCSPNESHIEFLAHTAAGAPFARFCVLASPRLGLYSIIAISKSYGTTRTQLGARQPTVLIYSTAYSCQAQLCSCM
jgi:hypothetical protein